MRRRVTAHQFLIVSLVTAGAIFVCSISRAQVAQASNSHHESKPPSAKADGLDEARALVNAGQFTEAENTLKQFLSTQPYSADAHFLLGLVLFRDIQAKASQEGRIDRRVEEQNANASLVEYTAGAKFRAPSAFDLKIVALDYVLLRDYVNADKWLSKSVELDPNDAEAWYYLGRTKYNEGRFLEAVRVFQECLARDTKNVKAEDNLGLSYAALDRSEEAIAAYQKAIAWQSESPVKDSGPFIDLGTLLLEENRPGEAVRYFSQGVTISPNESRAHAGLGKVYSKVNELRKAQDELETAVSLAPENGPLHYVLGQVYRKNGLIGKAKAEFDRAAELNGSHSSPVSDLPVQP